MTVFVEKNVSVINVETIVQLKLPAHRDSFVLRGFVYQVADQIMIAQIQKYAAIENVRVPANTKMLVVIMLYVQE